MNEASRAARNPIVRAKSEARQPALVPSSQSEARASSMSPRCHVWSSFHAGSRRSWAPNWRIDFVPESPSLWSQWRSRVPARSAIPTRLLPVLARRRGHAASAEKRPRAARQDSAIDSGRTAASRARRELRALTVGGVSEAGLNILRCQIGEVGKNLLHRHSRSKVFQHLINRNPHAADTGFTAALSRFNGDDVATVYVASPCRRSLLLRCTQRVQAKSPSGRRFRG
jgi:hypothetical protein